MIRVSTLLLLVSCQKENTTAPGFTTGKNRFTITVDGAEREFFVHVPTGYTGTTPIPLVIMFHGTGQSGEQFYNISGWKEVGDSATVLTVFPSALPYCITDEGVTGVNTKWKEYPGSYTYCSGVVPKEDINFIRQMITQLQSRYKIDSRRIYAAGFSNGSGMSARCAVELSDIFAATVSSGGGAALPKDTALTPVRLLPAMLMFGNRDAKMLKGIGLPAGSSAPMGLTQLYTAYPGLYQAQAKPFVDAFKLNPVFTSGGDTTLAATGDFSGSPGNPNNIFRIVEVKGMEHEYPNGTNHPLRAAVFNWAWFKQFSLP